MNQHGLRFYTEANSVSSGGAFENGFYQRPPIKVGLIVRGNKLGCPNYFWDEYIAGHNDLIQQLGHVEDSVLRFDDNPDKGELVTTDGRAVLDALVADLESIILPAISSATFERAVIAAHKDRMARLGVTRRAT
jgi:hypothetical protein